MKFAELLYKPSEAFTYSIVHIVNEKMYISSYEGYYYVSWNGREVELEEIRTAEPPSRIHIVNYWLENSQVQLSTNQIQMHIGEYISFVPDASHGTEDRCIRGAEMNFEYFEDTEIPDLFIAKKTGSQTVLLNCWDDIGDIAEVEVNIIN